VEVAAQAETAVTTVAAVAQAEAVVAVEAEVTVVAEIMTEMATTGKKTMKYCSPNPIFQAQEAVLWICPCL